jgi:hypothetical protein
MKSIVRALALCMPISTAHAGMEKPNAAQNDTIGDFVRASTAVSQCSNLIYNWPTIVADLAAVGLSMTDLSPVEISKDSNGGRFADYVMNVTVPEVTESRSKNTLEEFCTRTTLAYGDTDTAKRWDWLRPAKTKSQTAEQKSVIPSVPVNKPQNIPDDVAASVRRDCADRWKNDFDMRVWCENKQFKAFLELRGDK